MAVVLSKRFGRITPDEELGSKLFGLGFLWRQFLCLSWRGLHSLNYTNELREELSKSGIF